MENVVGPKLTNERMKALLKQFSIDKDLPKLLVGCAIWTAETIDAYEFKPLPMKPDEVRAYERIPLDDRANLSDDFYRDKPQLKIYYDLVRTVRAYNRSLYEWLLQCRALLLQHDPKLVDQAGVVDAKLKMVTVDQIHGG